MQHTPTVGSKKHRPSKSSPLSIGHNRSLDAGYRMWLLAGHRRLSSGRNGLTNHQTVLDMRWAYVWGTQMWNARKCRIAGPRYIPDTPWSAQLPLVSGLSQVKTLEPAGAIGCLAKSKRCRNRPWCADSLGSYSNGCMTFNVSSIWNKHLSINVGEQSG